MRLFAFPLVFVACSCKFAPAANAVASDVGPTLVCIEDAIAAGKTGTIEAAVIACGVAASDIVTTVNAIEALAAQTTQLEAGVDAGPSLAAKVRALPHQVHK